MSETVRPGRDTSLRSPVTIQALRLLFRAGSSVAPSLTARLAAVLFRLPPRHRTSELESRALRQGRPAFLDTKSGRLATWRWGEGPAVLLVHGWGSRGARLASFVEPIVAAGCSAITFDAPAHGDSAGRLSSLPQFMEATSAVAAAAGPVRAIVAHSLGGAAAALAIARGLPVQRVVLLAPAAHPGNYSRLFSERLAISAAVRRIMEGRFEQKFGVRWEEFDVPPRVSSLTVPLLVFHDREDTDVGWSEGDAIARAWPGGRLVTTQGLGHRRIVHDPEVVAQAISFLLEDGQRRRGVAP
ncbi:MAG TPA: alpha/beta hydrolase [Thermoanaerobaculia bacterium]|nr:alpha/beta hydrolase [Thermoanaerobaculia bacterium]